MYIAHEVRAIAIEIDRIDLVLAALLAAVVLFDLIFLWAFWFLHRGMRRFDAWLRRRWCRRG